MGSVTRTITFDIVNGEHDRMLLALYALSIRRTHGVGRSGRDITTARTRVSVKGGNASMLGHESQDQAGDLVVLLIQSKMAGVQQVDFGIGHIAVEG